MNQQENVLAYDPTYLINVLTFFPLPGGCSEGLDAFRFFFKQNVLSLQPMKQYILLPCLMLYYIFSVLFLLIRTRLDLLSIPQSGGGKCQNVY